MKRRDFLKLAAITTIAVTSYAEPDTRFNAAVLLRCHVTNNLGWAATDHEAFEKVMNSCTKQVLLRDIPKGLIPRANFLMNATGYSVIRTSPHDYKCAITIIPLVKQTKEEQETIWKLPSY